MLCASKADPHSHILLSHHWLGLNGSSCDLLRLLVILLEIPKCTYSAMAEVDMFRACETICNVHTLFISHMCERHRSLYKNYSKQQAWALQQFPIYELISC